MVGNGYQKSYVCIAFVLASALSLLAQADRVDFQQWNDPQTGAINPRQTLVAANLVANPMPGVDEKSDLPDAPTPAKPAASTASSSASAVKQESQGAPPAAMGGPLWVDRSVADRNYFLFMGAMFGASVANAESTVYCLSKHPSCNDVPSLLKSRTALYGIGIPADFGIAYLTYTLKRKHNSLWYVPAAVVTGANVFFAVRAYRWAQDPSLPLLPTH